jgi:lipoprotein-anchoring transpeptidase ErfK/SrfK
MQRPKSVAFRDVGRTKSHGCFDLANWNAEYLIKLVWVGMPVRVIP